MNNSTNRSEQFENFSDLFHERLRKVRKARGFTQEKVAKELGYDQKTYSNYERNRIPSLEDVIKIADILNCDVEYLCGKQGDYFQRDSRTIAEASGLSDEASENLLKMKGSSKMAVLDGLLRNDKFLDVLESICNERSEYFQVDPNYPNDYSDNLYPVGYEEYLTNESRHEIAAYRYDISVKFQEAYTEIDSCSINALVSDELQEYLNKLYELDDEPEQV